MTGVNMRNMKSAMLTLLGLAILLSGPVQAGEVEVEHYSSNPEMQLPFSDAVRVGNMLYLSGKIGNIPGTSNLAEGGIQGETRQALENIKASLEKYGSSMGEVVKCTVFLADIDEWGAMNEVYKTFFPVNPPARSALGASGLALNSRVEIECFAAMR
jgi:2-iminobutanoate/2-iminopropanoate deaminase